MNTEDKAKEIIESFAETVPHKEYGVLMERDWLTAKECALIAVMEIEKFMEMDDDYNEDCHMANTHWVRYWQEVKEHIQNLK